MPIKLTKNTIKEANDEFIKSVLMSIQESLENALNKVIGIAKSTDTYTDRTNNLRSSIGYVLYYDGVKVSASFEAGGKGIEGTGADGAKNGLSYADKVAKNYPSGFVAVMVAGMNYASYVEAKNFDVITGASLQLDPEIKKQFEVAQEEIRNVTGIDLMLT